MADCQAEAGAGAAAVGGLVEAVEEVGEALGGDAGAGVFDLEEEGVAVALGAEFDVAGVGVA